MGSETGSETGKTQAPEADNEADRDRAGQAEGGDEALNDARALQQMSEGVPDTTDEFRRIEQKR